MDKAKEIKDLYSKWAPKYDESFNSVAVLVEEDELIKIIAPKEGENILDIGCGTGRLTAQIYNIDENVSGVDLSSEMLEIAKQKLPSINFQVCNIEENLPFEDEGFDKVVSSLVFQFVQNVKTPFQEIYRVLKPNGTAFITTFVSDGTLNWSDIEYRIKKDKPIPSGAVQKVSIFRRLEDFLNIAKEAGFSSVSYNHLLANDKVKEAVTAESWEKIKGKWASIVLVLKK